MRSGVKILGIIALLAGMISCTQNKNGFTKTESGLYFKFIENVEGKSPVTGDIMQMNIIYLTENDSVLFDSHSKSDSFTVVLVEPTFTGGVEEGFAMMSPGDSAIFKASADSIFEKTFHGVLPAYMKPGSFVTFKVKLKSFISRSEYDSIQGILDVENRRMEFANIESYLEKNNMDVMPTENGVYLVTTKHGTGPMPVKGDTIAVNYTGRLTDGTIFDQSINPTKPLVFVLGANKVIQGWEECMPFLNKGSKATMLIPSDLGYGAAVYGTLPGYSTLVFDVEILSIQPGMHTADELK